MKKLAVFLLFLFIVHLGFAQNTITDDMGNVVFSKVEIEASFPDGADGWRKYLVKNLKADVPIKNDAPLGEYQVIVRFIVSRDGSISDVVSETNYGYGMEEEVVRIIKKGPFWTPAMQAGKAVNAYRRQPVTFVVQDDGVEIKSKLGFKLLTGQNNIVTIDIAKTDNEDLEVTCSSGAVKYLGGNRYQVNPTGTKPITLDIYNIKKKRKKIATAQFDVLAKL
ncbi:MAG: hypothetical protein EOO88_57455 [Pedobacter sp.]|nr:MAG: hypothetical protein EOO88_57455 [Pedobacter sp.]